MNFFYFFSLLLTLFIGSHCEAGMQRGYDPAGMPPRPNMNNRPMPMDDREGMPPEGYEAGMSPPEGYDEGYDTAGMPPEEYGYGVDERGLPPSPPMTPRSLQRAGRPSARMGFQQRGGMRGPERLPPPAMEENFEDDLNGSISDGRPGEPPLSPSEVEPTLPPRNYPPRMPEPPQFGQTVWNQMDLHSLVDGRRS